MKIRDIEIVLEHLGVPYWTTGELGKHTTRPDLAEMIYDRIATQAYNDGWYKGFYDGTREG